MFFNVQFAYKGVVLALYNLHHFPFASASSAACKKCYTYHIIGKGMCRVAFAYEYRLTAVLGVKLIVTVFVARECSVEH